MTAKRAEQLDDRVLDLYSVRRVGCFVLSNALAAEHVSNEAGRLLPAITALYRSYAIGGHFASGLRYPGFSQSALAELCRLDVSHIEVNEPAKILPDINEILSTGVPVIVPCDISELPYTSYYGNGGHRRYLVVVRYDADTGAYGVYDNLHNDPDGLSGEYSEHYLSKETLTCITTSFWKRFVHEFNVSNPSLFVGYPAYLLTAVRAHSKLGTVSALSSVRSCIERVVSLRSTASDLRWLDEANISHLVSLVDGGSPLNQLQAAIGRYLFDANFSDVYLDYLSHISRLYRSQELKGFVQCMEALSAQDVNTRMRVFVRILSGSASISHHVSVAREQLALNDERRVDGFAELLAGETLRLADRK